MCVNFWTRPTIWHVEDVTCYTCYRVKMCCRRPARFMQWQQLQTCTTAHTTNSTTTNLCWYNMRQQPSCCQTPKFAVNLSTHSYLKGIATTLCLCIPLPDWLLPRYISHAVMSPLLPHSTVSRLFLPTVCLLTDRAPLPIILLHRAS